MLAETCLLYLCVALESGREERGMRYQVEEKAELVWWRGQKKKNSETKKQVGFKATIVEMDEWRGWPTSEWAEGCIS